MSRISHITRTILAGVSASALLIATPVVAPFIAPAAAQTSGSLSVEFRTALTPYGSWRTVARWGEVWAPARVARNWQPYTEGNWVYSEDYGWYWISDNSEAEWGWIAYHYGRWAFDDISGWVWVPDNVWGPAWVDWRRGDEYVGWSPLPPDDLIVEYRENPRYWTFVRPLALIAPHLRIAALPLNQRQTILSRSAVVNRASVPSDRRVGSNPGIAPSVIATAARQPVSTVEVRPHVVTGTTNIRGAIEVSADDLRRGGIRPGQSIARAIVVQKTVSTVEPARTVPAPEALKNGEGGTLGDRPPRAAVSPQNRGTTGATVTEPTSQRIAPTKQPQKDIAPRPQSESAVPMERSNRPLESTNQTPPRKGAQDRGTAGTTGVAPAKRRQDGATPRQQREDAVPMERGSRTAPQSEPKPAPLAKAPAAPSPPVPAKPSAPPPHQDEKKGEDNKKQ
jgi:hypothetical protein